MPRRISRLARSDALVKSTSSILTFPASGSSSDRTSRESVDLPHPLSPTRPRVSPRRSVKLTPATAWTFAPFACRVRKALAKLSTWRIRSDKRQLCFHQHAGRLMVRGDRAERLVLSPADVLRGWAARRKAAAWRWIPQVRRAAPDRLERCATVVFDPSDAG